MRSHANVVVVGGGVVGCSVLYHLVKFGQQDCVLLERQELTSGSSWHAAGGLFTVTAPSPVAEVHKYTVDCSRELERESGQSCTQTFHLDLLFLEVPLPVEMQSSPAQMHPGEKSPRCAVPVRWWPG